MKKIFLFLIIGINFSFASLCESSLAIVNHSYSEARKSVNANNIPFAKTQYTKTLVAMEQVKKNCAWYEKKTGKEIEDHSKEMLELLAN